MNANIEIDGHKLTDQETTEILTALLARDSVMRNPNMVYPPSQDFLDRIRLLIRMVSREGIR